MLLRLFKVWKVQAFSESQSWAQHTRQGKRTWEDMRILKKCPSKPLQLGSVSSLLMRLASPLPPTAAAGVRPASSESEVDTREDVKAVMLNCLFLQLSAVSWVEMTRNRPNCYGPNIPIQLLISKGFYIWSHRQAVRQPHKSAQSYIWYISHFNHSFVPEAPKMFTWF